MKVEVTTADGTFLSVNSIFEDSGNFVCRIMKTTQGEKKSGMSNFIDVHITAGTSPVRSLKLLHCRVGQVEPVGIIILENTCTHQCFTKTCKGHILV